MPHARTLRHARAPAPGFSLIELMVVVAIIAIIAAIGYPTYTKYLVKTNRVAAQVHMMDLAQAQAQHLADSRSYAASVDDLGMTTPAVVSAKYTIKIALTEGPPSSFKITATPVAGGSQVADKELSIDGAGTRSPADKW